MTFNDLYINREEFFSMGIETASNRFYVSFPVSNGFTDYEEYYEIDESHFELFKPDIDAATVFVMQCRRREMDHLLMMKPGSNRGSAI